MSQPHPFRRALEAGDVEAFTQELRDGPRTALVFEARVRDRLVQGVSLLEDDEHGRIKTITVMIRPLPRPPTRDDAVRAQPAQPRVGSTRPAADRHNANAGRSRLVPAPR
jgi:hypothetical protein